jgi:hypothetical protein
MSAYSPPLENLPTFDTSQFTNANNRFLQYPVAQGTETFEDIIVNGTMFGSSTQVNTTRDNSNVNYQLAMGINGGLPYVAYPTTLYIDSTNRMFYNPSTNLLTVPSIQVNDISAEGSVIMNIKVDATESMRFLSGTTEIMRIDNNGIYAINGRRFYGDVTGNLTGVASQLTTSEINLDANYYMTFSDTGLSSNGSIYKTIGINCNPSSNTITASTFNGKATNIQIDVKDDDYDYNIPFTTAEGYVANSETLNVDGGLNLTYNPYTDTLKSPIMSCGTLVGTNVDNIGIKATTGNTIDFIVGSTVYLTINNTSIKTENGAVFNGNLTGNVTGNASNSIKTNTTKDISNTNYQLVMGINPSGSLGVPEATTLYVDGNSYMNYNPSTSTLTTPNLQTGQILNNGAILLKADTGSLIRFSIGTTSIMEFDNTGLNAAAGKTFNGNLIGTSTNIAGGSAGRIPYQTGVGTTSFIATGTTNQVLTSNSTSSPTWNNNFGLITGTLVYTGNQTFTVATNGTKLNMFYGGNATVTMPSSATDLTHMKFSIKSFGGVATTLTINNSGGTLITSITTPATTAGSVGTTLMYSTNVNISTWIVVQ